MRVVWLLRHAEAAKVDGQSERDLFSLGDTPLSARGREEAAAARDILAREPLDAVYASPLRRAQETARIVASARGLEVRVDARLAEIPVRGATYEEVLASILALPAELHEADERVARFAEAMEEVAATHAHAAVVAHGLANRAFLARVRGIPLDEMLGIEQAHAEATRLTRDAEGWRG